MERNSIWITWENQRRNRELSKAFNVKLFELSEIDQIKSRFKKYVIGITKTLKIYFGEKPEVVFCQNPSLILSLLFVLLKKITGIKVIVDAHNAGLFPKEGKSGILNLLSKVIQRYADLTIVTNEGLKEYVEKNGGKGFILQDKFPDIPILKPRKLRGESNILFICSVAEDEPYEAIFDAAKHLDSNMHIYVTGNYRKKGIRPSKMPDNISFTGFVPEEEYIEMLNSVDATIILTSRENCLVCGAYETVAVEKPMILSDTKALRDYFSMGAVYTENTIEGIKNAILEMIRKKEELSKEVKTLKKIRHSEWLEKKKNLEKRLSLTQ